MKFSNSSARRSSARWICKKSPSIAVTKLNQRLLLVGTGQSALNTTPSLQRLQARFAVRVQLSDADVESVIRKTVLRKKPEQEPVISKCLDTNRGEIARHLQNTRFAAHHDDDQ